jgi:hypothetical protein
VNLLNKAMAQKRFANDDDDDDTGIEAVRTSLLYTA